MSRVICFHKLRPSDSCCYNCHGTQFRQNRMLEKAHFSISWKSNTCIFWDLSGQFIGETHFGLYTVKKFFGRNQQSPSSNCGKHRMKWNRGSYAMNFSSSFLLTLLCLGPEIVKFSRSFPKIFFRSMYRAIEENQTFLVSRAQNMASLTFRFFSTKQDSWNLFYGK